MVSQLLYMGWKRDLTREGVEPNPGPACRLVLLNCGGMPGVWSAMEEWISTASVDVLCLQELCGKENEISSLRQSARRAGYFLCIPKVVRSRLVVGETGGHVVVSPFWFVSPFLKNLLLRLVAGVPSLLVFGSVVGCSVPVAVLPLLRVLLTLDRFSRMSTCLLGVRNVSDGFVSVILMRSLAILRSSLFLRPLVGLFVRVMLRLAGKANVVLIGL